VFFKELYGLGSEELCFTKKVGFLDRPSEHFDLLLFSPEDDRHTTLLAPFNVKAFVLNSNYGLIRWSPDESGARSLPSSFELSGGISSSRDFLVPSSLVNGSSFVPTLFGERAASSLFRVAPPP